MILDKKTKITKKKPSTIHIWPVNFVLKVMLPYHSLGILLIIGSEKENQHKPNCSLHNTYTFLNIIIKAN